jgi:hypothetical protein
MGTPGLVRIGLRDKRGRVSGLARPWRASALVAALDADPETIADLLVALQRFASGSPFARTTYEGWLGTVRSVRGDRRYTEAPASQGCAVFDLEARHVRFDVRGATWRRAGWLYYHDGEAFTRHRVPYRVPESWTIVGAPEERATPVEWNEQGPEPFAHLLAPDGP